MKRFSKILCIGMVTVIICSGCGNGDSGRSVKNNNTVDAVLQNEIDKSIQEEAPIQKEASTEVVAEDNTNQTVVEDNDNQELHVDNAKADPNVDIDISVMSSDMVYATVYQLMAEPDQYTGQTIKIKGNHYSTFYEPTGLIYHYALIQDAAACCAQGLEFQLPNGREYPEVDEEITVIGTFDTYEEEGYLYCILRNAVVL